MVTAHTVLGKTAAVAMLPALTLGMFAMPAAAFEGAHDGEVYTDVSVFNMNSGETMNAVTSSSNSGGNAIMATSKSEGGDSGDSTNVRSRAEARTANSAIVADVEGESEDGDKDSEVEVEAEAEVDGDSEAYSKAKSYTGDGGNAGTAATVSTISTGDATSDVAIVGSTDENTVDIDVSDDCECDRVNEYHETSNRYMDLTYSSEYDNWYKDVEEWKESEEESEYESNGEEEGEYEKDYESSYDLEEGSETGSTDLDVEAGESWEVHEKTYAPVTTVVNVANVNMHRTANLVASDANSGDNLIAAAAESEGGDSGNSEGVSSSAAASTHNHSSVTDVEGEAEDGEDSEVEVEAEAETAGDAFTGSESESATGHAGDGSDALTDSMIITGRSDSIVTIVETSRHNVIRIQR